VLKRFAVFLAVFQSILFLAHFFLFETVVYALEPPGSVIPGLAVALAVLSITFLSASLLAFRYFNLFVRGAYIIGAVWLGAFNYLIMAAFAWWLVYAPLRYAEVAFPFRGLAFALFGIALLTSVYGVINASWLRVKRVQVKLAGLPGAWKGRTVALVSDLHLGNIRNTGFARRVVRKISAEQPALVVIAGDLFDGTAVNAREAVAPLAELRPPLGVFFSEGNHEEFGDPERFLVAIRSAGVRVLNSEILNIEGLQLIGVPYRMATHTEHLRSLLTGLGIERGRASILLTHAPDRPQVAAEAGISLQVSGHTHRGQFFPYTWITRRMYRQLVYGLSVVGGLQVYTSCGAGTWGPPLRVGSTPEIVLITLE
jgi:predicted MPP superfamily phosphohydrolase